MENKINLFYFTHVFCYESYFFEPHLESFLIKYYDKINLNIIPTNLFKSFDDYKKNGGFFDNLNEVSKVILDKSIEAEFPININFFNNNNDANSYLVSVFLKNMNKENERFFLKFIRKNLFLKSLNIFDKDILNSYINNLNQDDKNIVLDRIKNGLGELNLKQSTIFCENFKIDSTPSVVLSYKNKFLKICNPSSIFELQNAINVLDFKISENTNQLTIYDYIDENICFTRKELQIIFGQKLANEAINQLIKSKKIMEIKITNLSYYEKVDI